MKQQKVRKASILLMQLKNVIFHLIFLTLQYSGHHRFIRVQANFDSYFRMASKIVLVGYELMLRISKFLLQVWEQA